MSPVFKTIITISIWVLFIKGLLSAVLGCVMVGKAIMAGNTPLLVYVAMGFVGIASLILACIAIKLRKIAE